MCECMHALIELVNGSMGPKPNVMCTEHYTGLYIPEDLQLSAKPVHTLSLSTVPCDHPEMWTLRK